MENAEPIESWDEVPEPDPAGDEVTNELVLSHSTDRRYRRECCQRHVEQTDEERAIIYVVYSPTPDPLLRAIQACDAPSPDPVKVVQAGGRPWTETREDTNLDVHELTKSSDLARLGVAISDALSDWAEQPTALCFYSLSHLLHTVELSRVFRFLHALGGRVDSAGTLAHYHLHPDQHDDQVVATLRPLFDSVVTVSDDDTQASGSG